MILLSVAGYACSRLWDIQVAFPIGILLGFVVAHFVPANTACSIKPQEPTDP